MARYSKYRVLNNGSAYYRSIRRGKKMIQHYETPIMHNPSVNERAVIQTTAFLWKYGSRLYNLAERFYGDPEYWWVIAWYNSVPTEAHIKTGDVIYIPINIEDAFAVLGV